MHHPNPCLECGACCANYRVSFYWSESDAGQGGSVPPEFCEDLPPFLSCMKGTNQLKPRCAALSGTVGTPVFCLIYPDRSSTCHDFGIHWQRGAWRAPADVLARCNQARAVYGLAPIGLEAMPGFSFPRWHMVRALIHHHNNPSIAGRHSHWY